MNNSTNGNTDSLQNSITNIIQFFLLLLNFFVGIAYVLLILIRKNFRSNKLNWLTVNVCLTTALLSLFQFIITILGAQQLRIMSCRLQGFLLTMIICQLMYAHCVSSFNRLLAIRYFHKLLFRSSRWLLTSMVIGWIVGLILAIPQAFFGIMTCTSTESAIFPKIYTSMTVLIIPISIVTTCNASIFRYIQQISRRVHGVNSNKNNNSLSRKRDAQVSKIMLLTFAIFVIGWTPIFFQQLLTTPERQLPVNVSTFFIFLLLISLLGDMILLICANQPVRQLIKEKLKCNGRVLYIIKC